MNKQRVARIIIDIERFFSDLENMEVKDAKTLKERSIFYAVSMVMFSIINRAIDLGEEIVSSRKLGFPENYREIFHLLNNAGIINEKLNNDLSGLVHFRNLAAHKYQNFNENDVYKSYHEIDCVKDFINVAKGMLKSEK